MESLRTVTSDDGQSSDKAGKRKRDPKREAISQHLRDAYRSVVDEPLPDMFEDLLKQLDDKADKDSSDSPKGESSGQ